VDVVVFVPGFFGFGAFGHPDRPLVEYFARVEDALVRARLRPMRFAVHQPPPAGSLADRVRSLNAKIEEVLSAGATRLHLVGHSTGGVDARLLCNRRYAALPPRDELVSHVASVVTLSAPLHGTPLARRLGRASWAAMPALWFGSILASRGRLRLAGQAATLLNLLKRATSRKATPTDQLIAQLADVDDDTAHQIRRFLADVAEDHHLVRDLTPEAMAELNRSLDGADALPLRSFVTVAPPPGISPLAFATAPVERLFYDLTWNLTAAAPIEGARTPHGEWIDQKRISIVPRSNDGIVPAWSQTLDGEAAALVLGDHLDVIGHYESVNATFLRSGSKFDNARFRGLWLAVAKALS
jgi:hypothetical protein